MWTYNHLEREISKYSTLHSRAEQYGSKFANSILDRYILLILTELLPSSSGPAVLLGSSAKALAELGTDMYLWNHKARTSCFKAHLCPAHGLPPGDSYEPVYMELGSRYTATGRGPGGSAVVAQVGMALKAWVATEGPVGTVRVGILKYPVVTEEYFR